jgi:hypothetical protein
MTFISRLKVAFRMLFKVAGIVQAALLLVLFNQLKAAYTEGVFNHRS